MVGNRTPRLWGPFIHIALFLALVGGPIAGAIKSTIPVDHGSLAHCDRAIVAESLAVSANIATTEATAVTASLRFFRVEPLLALYLQSDARTEIARRIYRSLEERQAFERVLHNLEHNGRRLVIQTANRSEFKQLSQFQIENLAEVLIEVLRCRDRRMEAMASVHAFISHTDRALRKRLEQSARQTLRTENKRRNALKENKRHRGRLIGLGIRTVTPDEEDAIGLPFLARESDFQDPFEIVVMHALFTIGAQSQWALCTAGDSLRVVLAHGEHEPSADLLAFERTSQTLWVIEIKRSPTGIEHAVEQLIETKTHLQRSGVKTNIQPALAFPRGLEMHRPFREGPGGFLLRGDTAVYVGTKQVSVMRF